MKEIFLHELFDDLKSARFTVMLLFAVALFSLNGLIYVRKFEALQTGYDRLAPKYNSWKSTIATMVCKPPCPRMFIAEGGEKHLPDSFSINAGGRIEPRKDFSAAFNFRMPDAPEIDWAFIIKVVFTLYVLLLGYSAISGERAQGTLRLALSNPVNRPAFLSAKYCAITATVLTPLLIGMGISLFIIGLYLPGALSVETMSRAAFAFCAAALFLSLFVFLTLLLSSLIANASTGLLLLLSVWIFAYVFPDVAGVAIRGSTGAASEYQTARQVRNFYGAESGEKYSSTLNNRIQTGEFHTREELQAAGVRYIGEIERNLEKIMRSHEEKMRRQTWLTHKLAILSPFTLLQSVCEDAAGTGDIGQLRFMEDIQKYSTVYDDYVREKTGKVVGESEFSFGWHFQYKGEFVEVRTLRPVNYSGDMSDFPKFAPSRTPFRRVIADALPNMSGLLLWNLLFAGGALWIFIRMDVR